MTQFDQRYQQIETQYNADQITIQQQPLSLTEKQRKQNRTRMLQRVQAIWIDGIFEPSLQETAQIALELQNKPSAIVTPLWHVQREFVTTGQLSSENASIVQVYDRASGEVLLLGEPGSGKTTLLLELTRTLLERARQDEAHPIPVVFPLSSWATTKRQPLMTWLASELYTKYQIPLALATSWIEMDQVLPLLDGLDEVTSAQQAACVEAINTYRQEHGLLPTVVCSRQTDYLALSTRLLLRTAVVVQPLTPEQIETNLTRDGERLEALRETLREDADLRALASTPLMLNVLTVAYQGTQPQEITTTGSFVMKQEQVFASYVKRMLTHRNTSTRYKPQQTIHWLSYLASQMKRQSQTIFYFEQMQPDWLSGKRGRRVYDWLAVRLPGVLMGLLFILAIYVFILIIQDGSGYFSSLNYIFGGIFSDNLGLPIFPFLILFGLLGGLLSEGGATHQPAVSGRKAGSALWPRLLRWFLIGSLIGFGCGLSGGLGFGLSFGVCSILLQILLEKNNTTEGRFRTPTPAREKAWWHLFRRRAVRIGLLVGLLVGLSVWLSVELSMGQFIESGVGLLVELSIGLSLFPGTGLSFGLGAGLSAGVLSLMLYGRSGSVQPTDLLVWSWRSLRKSLFSKSHVAATALVTVLIGLSFGLNYGLGENGGGADLSFGLSVGLGFGLSVGLGYWLLFGFLQGVSGVTIEDQRRAVPNQGIRRSALNGLVFGFVSTVVVGLVVGLSVVLQTYLNGLAGYGPSIVLSDVPSAVLNIELPTGILVGLSAGLMVGLLNGGLASLRHYVLRFLLWRSGSMPWNYPRFLDTAYDQILLRKVGGGYIFLHRLLLDYFADLETGSDS